MTPPTPRNSPRPQLTRRGLLIGGSLVALGAGVALWPRDAPTAKMSAPQAHAAANSGARVLVDIRRPDEWKRTGIAEGAIAIDMRKKDFEDQLLAALSAGHGTPIALICARGVRSRRLAARLTRAGFSDIMDVSEGMEGSAAGPGWVARKLPLRVP